MTTPVTGAAELSAFDHFQLRMLREAWLEATATHWRRRAEAFAAVGTPTCDQIARACRNRAALGDNHAALRELADTLAAVATSTTPTERPT